MHGVAVLPLASEEAMAQSLERGGEELWDKLEKGADSERFTLLKVVHFSLKAFFILTDQSEGRIVVSRRFR